MHAYLLTGNDPAKIEEKIKDIAQSTGSRALSFTIDKVENTRELIDFLKLAQTEKTAIVLRSVENATPESLNAFLKNLEEPGKGITFILTAGSEYKVLPTIISRCQVIRLEGQRESGADKNDLAEFFEKDTGFRLSYTDSIKKREDAVKLCQDILTVLQKQIEAGGEEYNYYRTAYYMECVEDTLDALNKNGNVTVQLTNMCVRLAKETFSASMEK